MLAAPASALGAAGSALGIPNLQVLRWAWLHQLSSPPQSRKRVPVITESPAHDPPRKRIRVQKRLRDYGLAVGLLPTGAFNSITDVPGVKVGHLTVDDNQDVQTGVTVVYPYAGCRDPSGKGMRYTDNLFRYKLLAAAHVVNGFGKSTGISHIQEVGVLESPLVLTNTMAVGAAYDAVMDLMLSRNEDIFNTTGSVNPVVLECNDMYLNSIRVRQVNKETVCRALQDTMNLKLGRPECRLIEEGSVGAGRGVSCFGLKGGIGTSSRVFSVRPLQPEAGASDAEDYVVGVLVLTNFGHLLDFSLCGMQAGRQIADLAESWAQQSGSQVHGRDMSEQQVTTPEPHSESRSPAPLLTIFSPEAARKAPMESTGGKPFLKIDAVPPQLGAPGSSSSMPAAVPVSRGVDGNGSVSVVVATNAPVTSHQLQRMCQHALTGIRRTGAYPSNSSGEVVVGFSTANVVPHYRDEVVAAAGSCALTLKSLHEEDMDMLFRSAAEATEEAVLNSMLAADSLQGRDGRIRLSLSVFMESLLKDPHFSRVTTAGKEGGGTTVGASGSTTPGSAK